MTTKYFDTDTLNDCMEMKVAPSDDVDVTLYTNKEDAWRGDGISIFTAFGKVMDCPLPDEYKGKYLKQNPDCPDCPAAKANCNTNDN